MVKDVCLLLVYGKYMRGAQFSIGAKHVYVKYWTRSYSA